MESSLLPIIKELFMIAVGPLIGLFAWVGKRLHTRIDKIEQKVVDLDKSDAIQRTQLKDIKEDIHSIDKKLDKILDKVRK